MAEPTAVRISANELEEQKHAPEVAGVPELIRKRWSPRAFADRPVADGDLETLFLAASWAASSYNEQPWRFLAGRKGDETYKKIFQALGEFNQLWAKNAPVLVLSAGKKTFSHNGSPNAYGLYDTGAATAYLTLTAAGLGLHSHSMAGFDKELARASFGIPSDFELGAVTAVGYFGDPSTLPEQLYKSEIAPRTRKPLEEFVFSEWGTAAEFRG